MAVWPPGREKKLALPSWLSSVFISTTANENGEGGVKTRWLNLAGFPCTIRRANLLNRTLSAGKYQRSRQPCLLQSICGYFNSLVRYWHPGTYLFTLSLQWAFTRVGHWQSPVYMGAPQSGPTYLLAGGLPGSPGGGRLGAAGQQTCQSGVCLNEGTFRQRGATQWQPLATSSWPFTGPQDRTCAGSRSIAGHSAVSTVSPLGGGLDRCSPRRWAAPSCRALCPRIALGRSRALGTRGHRGGPAALRGGRHEGFAGGGLGGGDLPGVCELASLGVLGQLAKEALLQIRDSSHQNQGMVRGSWRSLGSPMTAVSKESLLGWPIIKVVSKGRESLLQSPASVRDCSCEEGGIG